MPNFTSIGPFKQKYRGRGRICFPPAIPIYKKPSQFRVKQLNTLGELILTDLPQLTPSLRLGPGGGDCNNSN